MFVGVDSLMSFKCYSRQKSAIRATLAMLEKLLLFVPLDMDTLSLCNPGFRSSTCGTALICAARYGHFKIVRILIETGESEPGVARSII
jgi:hypothetical protein